MEASHYDYLFKIVLAGDSGTGKSNLLLRYTRNEYDPRSRSTIGVEFATCHVYLGGMVIKAQIWDTAGTQRYRAITSAYYRGASAVVITYDISRYSTFMEVAQWLKEARDNTNTVQVFALVGNKNDQGQRRVVSYEEAKSFAVENGMIFMETSGMNGSSVEALFQTVVTIVFQNRIQEQTRALTQVTE